MKQNHHFIVPDHNFQLVSGSEMLTTYTYNTGAAKHTYIFLFNCTLLNNNS